MSIESLMPSNHLILCLPLLLLSSVILSIRIFSSESALHISWPTYWRLRFRDPLRVKHPSVQFSSVTQSSPTLWDPMDCSTSGFPVCYHSWSYSNSCPLSQWCHPTMSSSVVPFSCPQSFPASGSFPMSQLFTSGGQSIGASASASVLPMNIQGWFPLGLTGLISLLSKGLSRIFSSTTVRKHQFFSTQPSLWHTVSIQ